MSLYAAAALALLGSVFFALGAAVQQHEAGAAAQAGPVARLVLLLRRPRWLLGAVAIGFGTALHLFALSLAPITVVQPMGVASMLFALPIAAALHGRRPRAAEQAAAGAVTAALIGLVLLVPEPTAPPHLTAPEAAGLLLGAAALVLLGMPVAARVRPALRSGLLGAGAGVLFGAMATLVRVAVLEGAGRPWLLLVAPLPALAAIAMLQAAYATGHFPVAFAAVQIADPVTAVACGALLLGEPLPQGPAAALAAVVVAAVAAAGVAVLARSSPLTPGHRPPAARCPPAPRRTHRRTHRSAHRPRAAAPGPGTDPYP